MIHGLDLFSGIGGISAALAPWVRPLAYCEQDRYAQALLLSRMADGEIARGPIWDDVRTLTAEVLGWPWVDIDIIYGGFPCQDISTAGAGAGLEGERSGLFFEIIRLVREVRPRFVFLENVPAVTVRGLDRILLEFNALGYDCRWTIISAAQFGAPHLRERWFLLASDSNSFGFRDERERNKEGKAESNSFPFNNGAPFKMADSESVGSDEGRFEFRETSTDSLLDSGSEHFRGHSWWATEPDVGRVAHGIPHRVDRIKGLGNAVVPLQAREAFKKLIGIEGI